MQELEEGLVAQFGWSARLINPRIWRPSGQEFKSPPAHHFWVFLEASVAWYLFLTALRKVAALAIDHNVIQINLILLLQCLDKN